MRKIVLLLSTFFITLSLMSQNVGQQGDTLLNYVDINGMKQGNWKQYHENGNPRYEAYFVDDKPIGKLTRWDNKGNLYAILEYKNTGEKATARFYHSNGKIAATGNYLGKSKDSIWLYYDENSHLYLQESYEKGEKHGIFKQFTSEGILIELITWKQGIKNGSWKKFYVEGPLMWEANFVDGKLEGDAKSYYKNGKLQKEGKFVNDLMEGAWLRYKENGTFEKVLQYKNGVCPEVDQENEEMYKELLKNKDQIEGPNNANDLDWLRNTNNRR
ncbi:MAG: toxin-antitoxin system YwqK family antitoxin [Salinivirgaceae bacterium]